MIEHTYQVLGYRRLLDIVSRYSSCPLGQSECLSLKPSKDAEFIDNELKLVSELRLLLKVNGFVDLSGLSDILPILSKTTVKGAYLKPEELLCILRLGEACKQSKTFLSANRSLCPGVYGIVKGLSGLEQETKALKKSISLGGEIKDAASSKLRRIREKKIRLRADLQKRLINILESSGLGGSGQDHLVTVRDGRYVVAVRTDQKSRVQGIIHDYSQTRATCFLEPLDSIQDNNRMAELADEEKSEEVRILVGLTDMVREAAPVLELSQYVMGRLDGLYARARFSDTLSCIRPEMVEGRVIDLKGARNPILMTLALEGNSKEGTKLPVAVDLFLEGEQNGLIISGPNRGGKTVALKTLGLMCLMAQSGMHIPAEEGSRISVYNRIMADIGDEQDIQAGLSTFSAHASNLKYIIENADKKSLVILDEPGMGTDPDEGAALAMSVIDFLLDQGAVVVVATHLHRLKTYGLLNKRTVNGSVEFDAEKKRPTFRMIYGCPGISHAMEIAGNIGVPFWILERAKGYLERDGVHLNGLIERLNRLMSDTEDIKSEAESAKRRYQEAACKVEERLKAFECEKEALLKTKRAEAEAAISEAREDLKQAINLLKNNKRHPPQSYVRDRYAEISSSLMDRLATGYQSSSQGEPQVEFRKGMRVYHKRLQKRGIIHSVDSSSRNVMVVLGGVKVSTGVNDLEVVMEGDVSRAGTSVGSVSWEAKKSFLSELNVIGYRLDDAIPLIDKTIDRALVEGESGLRIIHGFGSGRLREGIRAHLKEASFIRRLSGADLKSGGDAITVVEF